MRGLIYIYVCVRLVLFCICFILFMPFGMVLVGVDYIAALANFILSETDYLYDNECITDDDRGEIYDIVNGN